jgi:hypothetical protein
MSALKIHCTLGLHFFVTPQFTIVNAPIYAVETQTLRCWQVRDGLSSAFNWKMKKRRRFVNTIAPWPMLVRQSLRNLQRCGVFITAFTSKKMKDDDKKSLFRNGQLIQHIFIEHLEKMCLIANHCMRWRCNFKRLSQNGGRTDFLKNLRTSLLKVHKIEIFLASILKFVLFLY